MNAESEGAADGRLMCDRCGSFAPAWSVLERANGQQMCHRCWADAKAYYQHWFVKDLQYQKPCLRAIKRHKLLPNQGSLFE